ncbi:hypothetical protein MTR_8g090325 [Medicago truncatula]|uniref:Uncharacterized protein n=1 Tax=Medicago truncatula TaxID=3880 RepID=A0A072U4W7_MEDTR|nr:hypothetical protein MTR_8g090325 [Medicago truncatula]
MESTRFMIDVYVYKLSFSNLQLLRNKLQVEYLHLLDTVNFVGHMGLHVTQRCLVIGEQRNNDVLFDGSQLNTTHYRLATH